ncbi:hypothetical protein GIB67_002448 [Kingdonia uniflora]|uniref:Malectin-like domain-containing protein n=1 Tax=Kingdonia uniflora TaxID=39325 RepID=A0A7J7NCU2_9MAGN|nr:hypothetical protein GIB67_002448 [Kingdonia uniflora]
MKYTEFVSIDCGASSSDTDENSLTWVGDDLYVQSGKSHVVESPSQVSRVLTTLRAFPDHKKNCYSIKADKGDLVLVRTSFFYGNYDKKSSPPTFNLQFDGNHWEKVVIPATDKVLLFEVIYTVKGSSISVCVARTQANQIPFISAIEMRSLNASMYHHVNSNNPLFMIKRIGYGVNKTVRFPDDRYDRIWAPGILVGDFIEKIQSNSPLMASFDVEDNPPRSVLQSAGVATANLSIPLTLIFSDFPNVEVPVYINGYFSEVSHLNLTEKRSFDLYINYERSYGPITPPYNRALQLLITNITASSSTAFSLLATNDSTLAPLMNAIEVFRVGNELTEGTNVKDVDVLTLLQKSFTDQLQEWSGDPCLPAPFSWDWVACNSDARPRITALYLNGLGLSGILPDFSSMDALELIDLRSNNFTQEIPGFLGSFPKLKEFISGNSGIDHLPLENSSKNSVPSSRDQQMSIVAMLLLYAAVFLFNAKWIAFGIPDGVSKKALETPPDTS